MMMYSRFESRSYVAHVIPIAPKETICMSYMFTMNSLKKWKFYFLKHALVLSLFTTKRV